MSGQHTESSSARGYGYQWRKDRAEQLAKHPHCQFTEFTGGRPCGKKATTVDHRTHQEGGPLRSGCTSCHMKHSAKETGLGTHVGVGRANIAKNDPRSRQINHGVHRMRAPARAPGSFGDSLRSGLDAFRKRG